MPDDIISVRGLSKAFNGKPAVDRIDLDVRSGEIFGFLGPNGAGKTTAIRLMTTLANKDEGRVVINGHDVDSAPIDAKVSLGVVQQHVSLDNDLTVIENMIYHARCHKMPKRQGLARIEELITYLGIGEYRDYKVTSLSGGWKRRVSIACALIHRPTILFLDEPTVGLDIRARRLIWDIIRQLNSDGTTVFLTTHYIEEAESLCDRVAFINRGRIVTVGTPDELRRSVGEVTVETFDRGTRKTSYAYFGSRDRANSFVDGLDGGCDITVRGVNLEDSFVIMTGDSVGDRA